MIFFKKTPREIFGRLWPPLAPPLPCFVLFTTYMGSKLDMKKKSKSIFGYRTFRQRWSTNKVRFTKCCPFLDRTPSPLFKHLKKIEEKKRKQSKPMTKGFSAV